MTFQPDKIKREHVLNALSEIDKGTFEQNTSTKWDLMYNGKRYPPKDVGRASHKLAVGEYEWLPSGGDSTNKYFKNLGFLIVNKTTPVQDIIKSLIPLYKRLITSDEKYDEIYKWEAFQTFQNHWDLAADDLTEMVNKSFAGNLNLWTSNNYYPITMIKDFVGVNQELVRDALNDLLNENIDLTERIVTYRRVMDELLTAYNAKKKQENKHNYQDARTISLLLSFKHPSKHSLFKHSILKQFCEKLEIDSPKRGDIVNQILINDEVNRLVKDIISKDKELVQLHNKRLTPTSFKGDDNNILTQDFIYSTITYAPKEPKYWLYAPGENARKWEDFYEKGIMALGWDDLGDLAQYNSKQEIVKALQELFKTDSSKKNDATANYDFMSEMDIGDVVFVKKGTSKLLGYGLVESDYFYDSTRNQFKHVRRMNWKKKGVWEVDHNLAIKTLTNISDYPSQDSEYNTYHERLMAIINGNEVPDQKKREMKFPLNTILYGPPGTGKTYNTILRAVEIIENREIETYSEALKIFQENLHYTIEFITFHQNYSYEDFIQGLRPDTENDKELTFERKDGVFKVIADRALKNLNESKKPQIAKRQFEDVFNQFLKPLVEGEVEELEVKMKKVSYFITAVTNKSIDFRKASGGTEHTLSIATLRKMYEAESVLDIQGLASYYSPLLEELLKIGKDSSGKLEQVLEKNFVIIIDEINRANISRVFGELITLIEPDKRSHGDIPLEARLPSGDSFMVPSNLYIIGTMNTADKSIALLDIALRRRFEFVSMYPKYEIKDQEIYDTDILRKINEQIIKNKGHDFQIGHAYFMGENKDLVQRMNKKVIPLLLEYYMNDDKEVKGILQSAGLRLEEGSWPIRITGKND